jgi:hypothetical protein
MKRMSALRGRSDQGDLVGRIRPTALVLRDQSKEDGDDLAGAADNGTFL